VAIQLSPLSVKILITPAIEVYEYVITKKFQEPKWLRRTTGGKAHGPAVLDHIRGLLPREYALAVFPSILIGQ
jgi:hypothetical protein